MKIKIGFGYDVHRLKDGQVLTLGGIDIPSQKTSVGHSDADVLIHAICDALLGAANLRDIGFQFPDTDDTYENIDSKILLEKTVALLREKGFGIGNVDATVCLQQPKIAGYIQRMKTVLAQSMQIDEEDISIKATTTEKLGFVGREEGISAYAVTLIEKQ
jgi:2-C-methyl-D-erythritol 2,4-cyclodiphosphate synthase